MGLTELELIGRVGAAALLGAVIGAEREFTEKPAGLRTHALVALGAAAFTVAGYAAAGTDPVHTDSTRIAAQVVSGIGFLGGGIIIFNGDRLRGLTTAAELWTVAALGILCGLGFVGVAAAVSLITLVVVVGGRPVELAIDKVRRRHQRGRGSALDFLMEEDEQVEEPMPVEPRPGHDALVGARDREPEPVGR